MYHYTLTADIMRLWDGALGPWLVTLSIGKSHACYSLGAAAYQQVRCAVDDFGNLVMVTPFR